MRVNDQVIHVKNTFNERKVGDIDVINKMKVHHDTVVLNFIGDKADTWHGMDNYRLVKDVNIPMLEAELAIVAKKMLESISKTKNTKQKTTV
jgi:hypothetical protein